MRYIRLFKELSNWWLYIKVKLGLTKTDPLIFETRNRIVIEVPRRLLHEFKEIFMEGSYTRGLALTVPDRPTIIDIGANAGFFTFFAASRFPGAKIISYEPVESNFRQLERNRALNNNVQVLCFQKAVYGYSGKIGISFDPIDSFSTSASVFGRSNPQLKTVQVPCVTLPEIFDEHQLNRCNLLKMDCEGSEFEILYNCPVNYLHRIDQMAMEVHGNKEASHNMEGYLNSIGFKTRWHEEHMLWAWRRP